MFGTVDEVTQSIDEPLKSEEFLSNKEIDQNMDDVFKKSLSDMKKYQGQIDKYNAERPQLMTDTKETVQSLLSVEHLDFALENKTNERKRDNTTKDYDKYKQNNQHFTYK